MSNKLESDILKHINDFEEKLENTNSVLYDLEWKLYFSINDPHLKKMREKSISIFNDVDNFNKIKDLVQRSAQDQTLDGKAIRILNRWHEELSREILPTEKLKNTALTLAEFEDKLQKIRAEFKVEIKTGRDRKSLSFEETQNLLKDEKNRDLREETWRKREKLGKELLSGGFCRLIDDRNKFSKEIIKELGTKTSSSNFYTLRLEQMDFNEEELFGVFKKLKEKSDDLTYRIIEKRKREHGIEKFEPWDVSYLIYQEIEQLDSLYKRDGLNENVLKTATGLGFDPQSFNLTFDLYPKEGKLDNAFVFPISPPKYENGGYISRGDIRLFANIIKGGLREQKTLFHEWGHLLHCAEAKQKFYLFRSMQNNPSLTEGIAMLFERFPTEPEFISEILGITNANNDLPSDIKGHLEEFGRIETETILLELRLILARVFFEKELYYSSGNNPGQIWSKYMSDFLFTERHDDIDAWVERPHFVTSPVYYQCYAVASLLREQFYSHIKNEFGRIINNTEVGKFLEKKCFSLGSSMKWNEIVKNMVGEELNPDAFLKKTGALAQ